MKLPPSDLARFAAAGHSFRLHTGSGTYHCSIDSEMLKELGGRGWIRAYAKGNKLTWVQMTVPPYVVDRVLFPDGGGRRKSAKAVFHSAANDTCFLEKKTTTPSQNYQHHAERCSAWRPDRPPINFNK